MPSCNPLIIWIFEIASLFSVFSGRVFLWLYHQGLFLKVPLYLFSQWNQRLHFFMDHRCKVPFHPLWKYRFARWLNPLKALCKHRYDESESGLFPVELQTDHKAACRGWQVYTPGYNSWAVSPDHRAQSGEPGWDQANLLILKQKGCKKDCFLALEYTFYRQKGCFKNFSI